jgi:hypothetical protein
MGERKLPDYIVVTRWFERLLAMVVLVGVVFSAIGSVQALLGQDWSTTDAFYDLVYRVLLLVIGLELVRMLVTHELAAVLELLAFVIARKMLKPDLTSLDIALNVLAFVGLVLARWFVDPPLKKGRDSVHTPG